MSNYNDPSPPEWHPVQTLPSNNLGVWNIVIEEYRIKLIIVKRFDVFDFNAIIL